MKQKIEELREQAARLCAAHGVKIYPYGQAWWLTGNGINRVVAELAGLCRSDIAPLPAAVR